MLFFITIKTKNSSIFFSKKSFSLRKNHQNYFYIINRKLPDTGLGKKIFINFSNFTKIKRFELFLYFTIMEIFNYKQIKPTSQSKRTKVLLVCVFNQNSTLLSHDVFYNQFSKYGTIEKVRRKLICFEFHFLLFRY